MVTSFYWRHSSSICWEFHSSPGPCYRHPYKMSTLAFNVRGMQAKVGVSIAKDLNVELTDKTLECSTLLNARELVSCLEDLSFVGRVGASNAWVVVTSNSHNCSNWSILCSQRCAHARLLLPESACNRACPSMSSIPQPFSKLLLSISSRLDGVLPRWSWGCCGCREQAAG